MKDKSNKINLSRWIVSGGLLFCFALMCYILFPKYKEYNNASKRTTLLKKQLRNSDGEIENLEKENSDLQNSPEAIEKVAREKYKYCKAGEIVYYIKNKE